MKKQQYSSIYTLLYSRNFRRITGFNFVPLFLNSENVELFTQRRKIILLYFLVWDLDCVNTLLLFSFINLSSLIISSFTLLSNHLNMFVFDKGLYQQNKKIKYFAFCAHIPCFAENFAFLQIPCRENTRYSVQKIA